MTTHPVIREQFRRYFYAAIYQVMHSLYQLDGARGKRLEDLLGTYPFLRHYLREMMAVMPDDIDWDDGIAWWEQQITAWELDQATFLPLTALAEQYDLTYAQRLIMILAGLIEEDSRFGTLFARLQAPLQLRRPSVELVGRIMGLSEQDAWSRCRPLVTAGVLSAQTSDEPRSEWMLHIPLPLWDALRGDPAAHLPHLTLHRQDTFPLPDDLVLPEPFTEQVWRVAELIRQARLRVVIVRGTTGSDRLHVVGSLGRVLGRDLIVLDEAGADWFPALMPLTTTRQALPVIQLAITPGETKPLPNIRGHQGVLAVITSLDGGLSGELLDESVTLTLPRLGAEQRRRCWDRALAGHAVHDIDTISTRFHLPGDYIRQTARIAITNAELSADGPITPVHVRDACRVLNRQKLTTLAEFIEPRGTWDDLILSDATSAKLQELAQRCCHRERLLDHLAPIFGAQNSVGVRALFTGVSGTGKTLAATILAVELDLDLYRVDLASVVNKYIGETEKNLHQLFSHAEQLDVVLLLDEGDALLGHRTDVKSANDRYANLETNFLLQRLEHYQGIIIITTNAEDNIDQAFQRRMDVVARFDFPNALERQRIWQRHLPADHALDAAYLEWIAARCKLTGGQIRNAALYATLLALEADAPVDQYDVEQAVQNEYRKAGAMSPLNGNQQPDNVHGGMTAFLKSLS